MLDSNCKGVCVCVYVAQGVTWFIYMGCNRRGGNVEMSVVERRVSSVGLHSLQHSCVSVNRAHSEGRAVSSSVSTSREVPEEQEEPDGAQY